MCYSFKNINNIQNHIMKDSKPICNEITTFEIYSNKISTYLKAVVDELGRIWPTFWLIILSMLDWNWERINGSEWLWPEVKLPGSLKNLPQNASVVNYKAIKKSSLIFSRIHFDLKRLNINYVFIFIFTTKIRYKSMHAGKTSCSIRHSHFTCSL